MRSIIERKYGTEGIVSTRRGSWKCEVVQVPGGKPLHIHRGISLVCHRYVASAYGTPHGIGILT